MPGFPELVTGLRGDSGCWDVCPCYILVPLGSFGQELVVTMFSQSLPGFRPWQRRRSVGLFNLLFLTFLDMLWPTCGFSQRTRALDTLCSVGPFQALETFPSLVLARHHQFPPGSTSPHSPTSNTRWVKTTNEHVLYICLFDFCLWWHLLFDN